VEVALSGTDALERVRVNSPDLMLLDYEMPDMEAPEVLDTLRSGADRIAFPVIILTGARHTDRRGRTAAHRPGARPGNA
jgi:CheY-like chemotaxis protein